MFDFDKKPANVEGGSRSTSSAAMIEASINFDVSDLSLLVTETDNNINDTVGAYRTLMSQTLTESAGDINGDAMLIMEQANSHVKDKIVAALTAVRNWIVNMVKNLTSKLAELAMRNGKFLEKVKKSVTEKANSGGLKDFSVEVYEYDLNAINITSLSGSLSKLYKGKGYDLSKEYTESNKATLDQSVKVVQAMSKDDIAAVVINEIFKSGSSTMPSAAKMEAQTKLRKDGRRKPTSFSTDFIKVIEDSKDLRKSVNQAYEQMKKETDQLINEIKSKIKEAKKGDKEQEAFYSGMIAYYNAKRKILSNAIEVMSTFNNIKLRAALERVSEARKVVARAYNYKAVSETSSEDAVNEPYNPSLDLSEETEEEIDKIVDGEDGGEGKEIEEAALVW